MTDSYEKATNVCLQISAQDGRGALQICRVGTGNDSMPGLDFFVTTHGDPDAPQELFIYRRWPIDRLSKVMDTVGGPYQNLAVGALLFTSPEGENERKPLQSMLFTRRMRRKSPAAVTPCASETFLMMKARRP